MKKLEVFDPPMCCKSGICGSSSDPTLINFASDLEWLKKQGVTVVRYGLLLEPTEFSKNETVKKILQKEGKGCLPIIFVNNEIASKANYPTRKRLAEICDVGFNDEEAPPIHREENCCCGVDCDCSSAKIPQESTREEEKCENGAAEDNCFEPAFAEEEQELNEDNVFKTVLFTTLLLIMILLIVVLTVFKPF